MSFIVRTVRWPCNPSAKRRPAWIAFGSSGLLYMIQVLDTLPCKELEIKRVNKILKSQ